MNDADRPRHDVLAVLINWRRPDLTLQAAAALRAQSHACTIAVVDNGSGDGSVAALRGQGCIDVLMESDVNGGFGAGCNLAIAYAIEHGYDYVWLVNNDGSPEAGCLEALLDVARTEETIGAVGGSIVEEEGAASEHCGSAVDRWTLMPRYIHASRRGEWGDLYWMTGACLLLRCSMLSRIGSFDPAYFMYWEDADLCQRALRAGWKVEASRAARMTHAAGTTSRAQGFRRQAWYFASQLEWMKRYHPRPRYARALVYLRAAARSVLTGNFERLRYTLAYSRNAAWALSLGRSGGR
jgi:GT2 family glycosyltransferase